jgi:hypothetical protein
MPKKILISAIAGGIITLFTSAVNAAIITFTTMVPFTETEWQLPITLPKYNPADFENFQLRAITITAAAQSRGTYILTNTGTSSFRYGTRSDEVGATITINGPSSILLEPSPITNIGTDRLPSGQSISRSLNGFDEQILDIDNAFFSTFIGSGVIDFEVLAEALINVSKTGTNFSEQGTLIEANLALTVTYENDQPTLEIPETSFGGMGVAFCGLAALLLKKSTK